MNTTRMRNLLATALAVFALWSLPAGPAWAQRYMDDARKLVSATRYEDAIKILEANRTDAQRRKAVAAVDNMIGWSYFCLGKMAEAELYLGRSLAAAEQERNAEVKRLAANNLGVLYFVQGDLDKSLAYFSQPYTRNTKIAQEYRSLIEKKRVEVEAERNAQQGIALRTEKKFDEAVQSYDKALSLTPGDPRLLEFKGYALFRQGRHDDALAAYQAAMKADPAGTRTLLPLNMIKAYCATGRDGEIAPLLRSAGVSAATLQSWWDQDRELRTVCAQSAALRQALGR